MALIFPRLAQNFIKNGYFPTDAATLSRILSALDVGGPRARIYDPCCGEGVALAEIRHGLAELGGQITAFGVEYDQERAWHAKTILDQVIHADIADVMVSARSMGLLFLNPPYGLTVADRAGTGEREKSDRLEKAFYRQTITSLQFGGVLVLIVPHYVLDQEFANLLARNLERVSVWMAPEQQFKQSVLFGIKRRVDVPDPALVAQLVAASRGELPPELPEQWVGEPYVIPVASPAENFAFSAVRIDAPQLADELAGMPSSTLWPQFEAHCQSSIRLPRRPLRDLSQWHLALALASGQISGLVESTAGRRLLIKGATFKDKVAESSFEEREDGGHTETRTLTDRFTAVIKGIDFTEGAEAFGEIVTIR